jgi:uncharacterized protein (TIGR03435 family)
MKFPMARTLLGAALLLIASHAALGQPSQSKPAFDAASIKESTASDSLKGPGSADVSFSPGNVTARNATIKDIVIAAYRVRDFQVSGPSIIGSSRYDIRARITDPASTDLQRLMLQTLLADRFHLTLHRETRDLSVYALALGKNPSFPKSKHEGESSFKIVGANMMFLNFTMEKLAAFLSVRGDRPVIDETGLEGQYDLTVQFADPDSTSIAEVKQALGRAMADGSLPVTVASQLGLKLDRHKGPVEMLVIDHAEKASEN